MRSIGQVIHTYREQKQWSLQRLAKETSVPVETLQALEDERFEDLPAAPLVRGYIQLIASTLGIPEDTAIALWRRDSPLEGNRGKTDSLQSRSETVPFRGKNWWRPQLTSWLGFGILLIGILAILVWQWREIGRPPELTINSLENFAILESPVQIQGKTDSDATVTVNTQLISLDPEGNFSYMLELPAGERTIVIQSTDAQGRVAEAIYFVTVE